MRGMTVRARWVIGVTVLLLGTVIALWPRGERQGDPAGALESLRTDVALPDCAPAARGASPAPGGTSGDRNPAAALRGVHARCQADGNNAELAKVAGGRLTLLNVWATWCAPCREELPLLDRYASTPGSARVVTLQVESGQRDGLELLRELGVRLPTLHDGSGAAQRALKVPPGLPASYVITPDGRVNLVAGPRVFHELPEVREAVARYSGTGQGDG